jgi:putative ABC transport system permease protein
LLGVTFAVILMLVQSGIYFGYMNGVSGAIDHCEGDLWIAAAHTINADTARPIPEEDILRIKATPGIAWAEKLTHGWAYLKLPDGSGIWSQVVGFNPDTGIGGPWEVVQGRITDLKKPGTYMVDEASLPLLNGARVGDKLENFDQKMEIAGISRGAKSYNTYPVMFTSYKTAQEQSPNLDDRIHFIVAKFESGADRPSTLERLRRSAHLEVYAKSEFSRKVRSYWATKTGIGVGIGITVLLGFIVGLVVVGQTLYSATVEKLRDYATLKAMGATNFELGATVWTQAGIIGLFGYMTGSSVAVLAKMASKNSVAAVDLGPGLFVVVFFATLVMCLGGTVLSILRVLKVDPAVVFR